MQGLSLVAGALIITPIQARSAAARAEDNDGFQANPFLKITPAGQAIVVTGQCEMGQGAYTALAQCVADELDMPWDKVDVEAAPVDKVYFNPMFGMQTTSASSSVPLFYQTMRTAGAQGRDLMIRAAAQMWGVASANLKTKDGKVIRPDGVALRYEELLEIAATLPLRSDVTLKSKSEFRYIGRSMPRVDAKKKSTGAAIYGIDFDAEDRLVAVLARKTSENATIAHVDKTAALAVPGVVRVVDLPMGIAVVAEHFWAAKTARDRLNIKWASADHEAVNSADLWKQYRALAQEPGYVVHRHGQDEGADDAALAASPGAARQLDVEYRSPYQAHAPMEPLNCTVLLGDGRCDVWIGSQLQSVDRSVVAGISGLEEDAVHIHNLYLGGGFGRRAAPDGNIAAEAAHIAVAMQDLKRPIKVMWTREDDIQGGFYRPMALNRMQASLDAQGKPTHWRHRIVVKSIVGGTPFAMMAQGGFDPLSVEGATELPYNVANVSVDLHSPTDGPRVLWWRSIGHMHTALAVEAFMDELAVAAGKDPFDYRLSLLSDDAEQQRRILQRLKALSNWQGRRQGAVGRGLVLHKFFTTPIAAVLDVMLEDKAPRVTKINCVLDCGLAVNPRGVQMQIEGALVYGLSAALNTQITLKDGIAEQSNFDLFEPLRMDQMPEVVVDIMQSEAPPSHVAEAATPLVGPGLSNALFSLTGKRIRELPIKADSFA
ncbi:MAG: molybdopterin cofactor-binding domain-containing protein [Pseudomonadota bacterium]